MAQYRQVYVNRRAIEEAKKITSNKIATKKVHLPLKISGAFDRSINSTTSLSLSTTNKERTIRLIQKSSNIIKDAFVYIGGKLAKLPNQRRDTVARDMIQIMD